MGRKLTIVKHISEAGPYRVEVHDGFLKVYKKPGVIGKCIKTDDAFTNTRLHNNEFRECAVAGKMLRQHLSPLLSDTKDKGLVGRVLKLMHTIQNTDDAPKGYKSIARVFGKDAIRLLTGFNFLTGKTLDELIFKQPSITKEGIRFTDFVGANDLLIPSGATHAEFQGGCIHIDFAAGLASSQYAKPVRVLLNNRVRQVGFKVSMDSAAGGICIFVLKLNFYQKTFRMRKEGALQIIQVV